MIAWLKVRMLWKLKIKVDCRRIFFQFPMLHQMPQDPGQILRLRTLYRFLIALLMFFGGKLHPARPPFTQVC